MSVLTTEYVVINDRGVVHVRVRGSYKTLCGVGTWDELRVIELYEPIWLLDRPCKRCAALLPNRPLLCEPQKVKEASVHKGDEA